MSPPRMACNCGRRALCGVNVLLLTDQPQLTKRLNDQIRVIFFLVSEQSGHAKPGDRRISFGKQDDPFKTTFRRPLNARMRAIFQHVFTIGTYSVRREMKHLFAGRWVDARPHITGKKRQSTVLPATGPTRKRHRPRCASPGAS